MKFIKLKVTEKESFPRRGEEEPSHESNVCMYLMISIFKLYSNLVSLSGSFCLLRCLNSLTFMEFLWFHPNDLDFLSLFPYL